MSKRWSGDRSDHGRGLGVFLPGFEHRVRHGSYQSSSHTYAGCLISAQQPSFRLGNEYCAEGGRGYVVAHLVGALRYKPLGRGFDFFRPHYGPRVYSASNINGYKGVRCTGLTILPCADCLDFWEPQSSGAVNGLPMRVMG